jgi:hypothetical protein
MEKRLSLFIVFLCIVGVFIFLTCEKDLTSVNVSQDVVEALRYYPLQVGNEWVYASLYKHFDFNYYCVRDYYYLTICKVLKDTIMSNEKRYYKIRTHYKGLRPADFQEIIDWQRVDSLEGKVYRYDPNVANQEYCIDDLTAEVNQKINSHRYETHSSFWSPNPTTCESIESILIFDLNKSTKNFIEQYAFQVDKYRLIEDLGLLYHSHQNEYANTNDSIKGCVVNNTTFGDTSLIVEHEPPRILELTVPNGGEIWQAGSSQNIEWTEAHICGIRFFIPKSESLSLTFSSSH